MTTIFINKNSISGLDGDFLAVKFHETAAFKNQIQFNMFLVIVQSCIFFNFNLMKCGRTV